MLWHSLTRSHNVLRNIPLKDKIFWLLLLFHSRMSYHSNTQQADPLPQCLWLERAAYTTHSNPAHMRVPAPTPTELAQGSQMRR